MAALLGDLAWPELKEIPDEDVSDEDERNHRFFTGCLALMSMIASLRQCEYYFRRYSFGHLPITRSDHLRNCAEMYFDRIAQLRDRLKLTLNAAKKLHAEVDLPVGHILKEYERVFKWEIRTRNRVHHEGRYDDQEIDQLALLELLQPGMRELDAILNAQRLYRKAARGWVTRINNRAALLTQFMEQLSEILIGQLDKLKRTPN